MVQTHLAGLTRLTGHTLGVAADGGNPRGVCRELVGNILQIEAIKSEREKCLPCGLTFLSAGVGFSVGQ